MGLKTIDAYWRHHAASAIVDNKIYLTGGRLAGSTMGGAIVNVNVTEMYDTETEKWTAVEPMPSERSGIAAAAILIASSCLEERILLKHKVTMKNMVLKTVNGYYKNQCLLPATDW